MTAVHGFIAFRCATIEAEGRFIRPGGKFGRSVNSAEEGAGGGNMVSPAKKKSDRWDGRSKGKN
jgi:hypothetical protein